MGRVGGYYFGEKKKRKKKVMEKKARELSLKKPTFLPKVEIIGKGKRKAVR